MKTITFHCSKCKNKFEVEDGTEIDDIKCTKCGEEEDLYFELYEKEIEESSTHFGLSSSKLFGIGFK